MSHDAPIWKSSLEVLTDDYLHVGTNLKVMRRWETPVMRAMAERVSGPGKHVLEVGFGMGISAQFIQDLGCDHHVVVECHPQVAARARVWARDKRVTVIEDLWQNAVPSLGLFDGVFFDVYGIDAEDNFWPDFLPRSTDLIKPSGSLVLYVDAPSVSEEQAAMFGEYYEDVVVVSVPVDPNDDWAHDVVAFPCLSRPRCP